MDEVNEDGQANFRPGAGGASLLLFLLLLLLCSAGVLGLLAAGWLALGLLACWPGATGQLRKRQMK
jgi:hypothetical protein